MKLSEHLRPRRMFWRIYLYGLLMLGSAVLALGIIAEAIEAQGGGRIPALDRKLEQVVKLAPTDAPELEALMQSIATEHGRNVTLYDLEGRLRHSTANPPPPMLDENEWKTVRLGYSWITREEGPLWVTLTWRGSTLEGYMLRDASTTRRGYFYLGLVVTVVLLVLALLSIPLARAIASPLERLTQVVGEFGQGQLSARANLKGRNEVAMLGRAFDEMAARKEALIRGQKELMANVSHELRTPLARLGVTLDLVEDGQPEELATRLPELRRDIGELQQLVDGVMQMARLDLETNQAGQPGPRVQRVSVSLPDFLRDTAERFQRAAPECPLALELPEALPALEVDPVLVRRALHNLLDNARKYSGPGSAVTLRASVDGDTVRLEVEDRGIGVSATDLPQLTTPFFRTDRSRARETGGVGLGLTLVRRIVEAHGGTLSFQHAPEQGTRATLVFPKSPGLQSAA
ncbi:HAMP domain-containing histidine kinase [Myxococcus sp. K38C18041901]|uniref:sensor histidine kinase n=1 Tax=Myxococcus guangdongensis TaxID=2906760 RepID=UPI0020A70909|nr:HAMP domain-containing sensor histidine kinase [Myxococcus guangdongensis]MCP3064770.1 HAMP domain-containing histidine kinase [Myxococcus guangdongensis]